MSAMKVTFLSNSGFTLEYEDTVLIFDYYQGKIPTFDKKKKMVVFASHVHYDHYQESIFHLQKTYDHMTYILSEDIRKEAGAWENHDNIHFLKAGNTFSMTQGERPWLTVRAYRSTDEGVAFLIQLYDKCIYHAGDLNWWHWEGESDRYNQLMKEAYQREIQKLSGKKIDVAFVPLDPRQEAAYYWGMDYFMKTTRTNLVFPMHMQGEYGLYERLQKEPEAADYKEKVMHVTDEMQEFVL